MKTLVFTCLKTSDLFLLQFHVLVTFKIYTDFQNPIMYYYTFVVVACPHWPAVLDQVHDVYTLRKSNTVKGSSVKSCLVSPRNARM